MFGNIRDMTVQEAWMGEAMQSLKRLQVEGRYANNPVCRHCILGTSDEQA
jgi:hypothetical protein